MNTIEKLDKMLKKASKVSDSQAKDAALLLHELYVEAQDNAKIADYLMRFKPTICLFFFEKAVQSYVQEKITSLHTAICATEGYKKNANHIATTRGFILAAILIRHEAGIARSVLMRTLADAEKDGMFSSAVISNFKKYVVDYCGGMEPIATLGEKVWNESENHDRFIRFMKLVNSSNATTISIANGRSKEPETRSAPPDNDEARLTEGLLKMLSSASKEAAALFQSLSGSNGTISLLQKEITSRDSRIAELSTVVTGRDESITELQQEIAEFQQMLRENEAHISDLSERLKTAMQMDNISQNQELLTLKTNLRNGLKIEYADYLISKDCECNPDTYGALIGSLTRIFKTLRRFGITIE